MTTHKKAPLAGEAAHQNTRPEYSPVQQIEQILFAMRLTAGIVAAVTIGLLIVGLMP